MNNRITDNAPLWLRLGDCLARPLRGCPRRRPALLVIRPGSLGDALLFTGALRALRQQYPHHDIVLACVKRAQPVFARAADYDTLITLDDTGFRHQTWAARLQRVIIAVKVFRRRYDLVLYPAIRAELDTSEDWAIALFNRAPATRRITYTTDDNPDQHELDLIISLLQRAGCAKVQSRQDIWPEVALREAERTWARDVLGNAEKLKAETLKKETDQGPRTKDQDNDSQNLQSTVYSLKSSVSGLQSNCFTLALCPGARFTCKDWGAEKYAELLTQLGCRLQDAGVQGRVPGETCSQSSVFSLQPPVSLRVLLLGGPEDSMIAEAIIENAEILPPSLQAGCGVTGKVQGECEPLDVGIGTLGLGQRTDLGSRISDLWIEDWTGQAKLHESVALIEQSDLCIGNDTFGLHAAIAVGTPSVVIMWGGDGDRWAPWGDPEKHRMVRADVPCAGCHGNCTQSSYGCMEQITPDMVLAAIERLFHPPPFAHAAH